MKKILYGVFILMVFNILNAKSFVQPMDTVKLGEVIVGETKVYELSITNNLKEKINLVDIKKFDDYDYYDVKFTPTSIEPESSASFNINVTPKHNLNTYLNLFIQYNFDDNSIQYLPITIFTKGVLANPYYNNTQNLWGTDLYNALQSLIRNHNSYSYKEARIIIWTGADRTNGSIECIYTGRTKQVDDEPDFAQYDSDGFNTEHVWPRAFGADDEPELSDMFHIYPTFKTSNTKRDNYPFDYVVSNVAYEDGGSKLGKNANGQIAFEVRDVSKGNIARSMFYFATCYGNIDNNLTNQEKTLREWELMDAPDTREINRNDSIYKYQNNRNPYIDFPAFLERMPNLSEGGGDLPVVSEVSVIDTLYQISGVIADELINLETYLFNKGNKNATLKSVELIPYDKNFKFDLSKTSTTIRPNSYHTTHLIYDAKSNDGKSVNDTAIIKVELSDGQIFTQKYVIMATINSIEDEIEKKTIVFNNPSNAEQVIELPPNFELLNATLSIVNLNGDLVYSSEIDRNNINLKDLRLNLDNGTYFLNFKNSKYSISKKIIIIK